VNDDPIETLVRLAGRRPRPDADAEARVRAAVQAEWQRGVRARRRTRFGALAAAAAIAVIVATLTLRTPAPKVIAPAAIVARVESVHGASALAAGMNLRAGARVALPEHATASLSWNGVTLRIDGLTELRIDGPASATLTRGAVYVATGNVRGVIVRTPFGEVRDVGTTFEVRVRGDATRVRVRDGAVTLRGATAQRGIELTATRSAVARRSIDVSGNEWSWIERAAPPVVLEGTTLDDVVARVATEKGLRVEWRGGARDVALHGSTPLTLDEALDAATAASGATYTIEGQRLIVRTR
jgi:ferric-dicitrate binding protein FerR (iron transport regulator)